MAATRNCDVAIVGGGLAGGLIAYALARLRPDVRLLLVEGSARLGGNHVWSFFGSDVARAHRWLVAPFVAYGWGGYDVAFPGHSRTVGETYHSIESERFDAVLRGALDEGALLLGARVLAASPTAVVLADGTRIEAGGVIDARGPADLRHLDLGWQKFVGRELALEAPHGLSRPIVMDATVEQADGYRFVYCLPFARDRLFVEDTYYSDTPDLDRDALDARIDAYAAARGWRGGRTARGEEGALPVAMGGDFEAYWRCGGKGVAKAGLRAGLFHPLTGYSLPDAVRTAVLVARAGDLSGANLHDLLHGHARAAWRKRRFYRMLAAMLFRAAEPGERYRILERFYRLDAGLIGRFYAGRSSAIDKARILIGKPPVPVGRALAAIRETRG